MVFQDRPDRPGKADLQVIYFSPLVLQELASGVHNLIRNTKPQFRFTGECGRGLGKSGPG